MRNLVLVVYFVCACATSTRARAQTEPPAATDPAVTEAVPASEGQAPASPEPEPEPMAVASVPEHEHELALPVINRAPRMLSATLGFAYSPDNDLPLSTGDDTSPRPIGLAIEARYGWQVGGLDGGRPSWVGLSTSFFAFTRGADRSSLGIDYGLFVRHALMQTKVRPFLGYGLGATQVFVHGVRGRGIGHLTTLSLGIDVRVAASLHVTVELAYRFVILPTFETELEDAHRYDFHALRLVAGVVYGR